MLKQILRLLSLRLRYWHEHVGADVGTHIEKGITGPEGVEHKGHVGGFMLAAVEIHGGAGHAGFDHQRGATHPGHDHWHAQQATAEMPTQETGHGAR